MTHGESFQVFQPLTPVPRYDAPASTDDEAKNRFQLTASNDPYPSISPALLNSADIFEYINTTGMIFPFYEKDLKSASYAIRLLGETVYWDASGSKNEQIITKDDQFQLGPNSIAFVTTEPIFRLPDYIAIRFNLQIEHVHRGILLGTGPLVDPGFSGRLLIPLHNLTTNTYILKGGEELIWVEFTKISPHSKWHPKENDPRTSYGLQTKYVEFPERKKNKDARYYLSKASPHQPIRSSLPDVIRHLDSQTKESVQQATEASNAASKARDHVESIKRRLTNFGVFGGGLALLVAALTLVGAFVALYGVVGGSEARLQKVSIELSAISADLREIEKRVQTVEAGLNRQNAEKLSGEILKIESAVSDLRRRLDSLYEHAGSLGQSSEPDPKHLSLPKQQP